MGPFTLNNGSETYTFPLGTNVPPHTTIRVANPLAIPELSLSSNVMNGDPIIMQIFIQSFNSSIDWDAAIPAAGNSINRIQSINIGNPTFTASEWDILPLSDATPTSHHTNLIFSDYDVVWSNGLNNNTISNIAPGTFYYTVVHAPSGCVFNEDSVVVTATTTNSISASICEGETYDWNGNSYYWPGQFVQTFTSQLGCDSIVTLNLTVNQLPNTPTISSLGTIVPCSGGSMTLSVPSGYSSYLWTTGSTSNSILVSQSGNYFVSVTDNNGCSVSSYPFDVNASFIAPPQVCIVGVDSLTNENRVVWEKPLTQGIDSFYVYKESNVSNVYTKIGATDYNDLAVFLDVNSNPVVQAYRYKISALDTCGVETNVGDFHKTIHLTINQGIGGAWNLIWSHYEGLNFGSYNIYRGTDPSNISLLTTIQSNLNSYSDLTPPTGPLYYQIEVVNPVNCDPTKVLNYGVSRSNIVNNGVSGVKEIANTNILVYPNPTNSNITLQVSSELVGRTYSIQDFSGRAIINGKIRSTQDQIELQDFARGAYYLSIENGSAVTKIIKQ
jgi:hypothetical protein